MSIADDYPALTGWLRRARPNHPFDPARMPPPFGPDVARALDRILADVDAANPQHIGDKRAAFKRESDSSLLNLRVELLLGSLLARAGIVFDFGDPHPDLICRAEGIGVEVATRSRDAVRALHDRVEEALAAADLNVLVSLEFIDAPLWIPEAEAAAITQEVVAEAARDEPMTRHFANGNLRVMFFRGEATPAGRVVYNRGALLDPHFDDVEREILNKVEEKRRQAGRMPTILLVDFSRLGLAWLRPLDVWASRLAQELFQPSSDFIGLAVGYSVLTDTAFQGTATWQADLPRQQADAARSILTALVQG